MAIQTLVPFVTYAGLGTVKLSGDVVCAGEAVYLAADTKIYVADKTSADTSIVYGIALNSANPDQPVSILTSGHTLTVVEESSPAFTVGQVFVLGSNGTITDLADLSLGEYFCLIGYVSGANTIALRVTSSAAEYL